MCPHLLSPSLVGGLLQAWGSIFTSRSAPVAESLGSSPTAQPGLVKPGTQAIALCSGDGQLSSPRPSLRL